MKVAALSLMSVAFSASVASIRDEDQLVLLDHHDVDKPSMHATEESAVENVPGGECIRPDRQLPSAAPGANRVLVIMICSTRGNQLSWASLKAHLLDELGADLALAVSAAGGGARPPTGDLLREHAKFLWEVPDPPGNEYRGAYEDVAKACGSPTFDPQKLRYCHNTFGGLYKGTAGSGAMLWYFRYLALQHVLADPEAMRPYTHFVVTRSDYSYTGPHPRRLLDDALMIPSGEDYGGVTDRHTVIPRAHLAAAIGMLSSIVTDTATDWCASPDPEIFLKQWYASQQLPIVRFPRVMFALVSDAEEQKTSYAVGTHHADFPADVRVKYAREYGIAKKTGHALQACEVHVDENCRKNFKYWYP